MIVPLEPGGKAEEVVRQCLQANRPTGRGERQGALAGGDSLVMRAHDIEIVAQKERDPSEATRVIEGRREGLSIAQQCQDTPHVARWTERIAQGKPKIDGLLTRVTRLWQMREGTERLLEVSHGLAVG